jgi:hypothetical protein
MGSRGTVQTRGFGKPNGRLADDPVGGIAVTGALGDLVTRIQKLERAVSEEKGDFDLFGLFLRDNSTDRWDLVVAAKWIVNNKKQALDLMSVKLKSIVRMPAMLMISRIVLLTRQDAFLIEVQDAVRVDHGLHQVSNVKFGDVSIEKGFVITSRAARNGRLRPRR